MSSSKRQDVFLNVPFDGGYEPLFVALVASIISLGMRPRCVLEVVETGSGRLRRIEKLISECGISIHDLSRVNTPVRFNMPFELGLARALKSSGSGHQIIVLENKPYRLDQTLSDYKGRDALIHGNSRERLVSCILDLFQTDPPASPHSVRRVERRLNLEATKIKGAHRRDHIFFRTPFLKLSNAAVSFALDEGLLQP